MCRSANGSVNLVYPTVLVNCLSKQFTISLGVFLILLSNVMEVLSVDGGVLLDIPCIIFQNMCVLCL